MSWNPFGSLTIGTAHKGVTLINSPIMISRERPGYDGGELRCFMIFAERRIEVRYERYHEGVVNATCRGSLRITGF
jgi:hypothetical protein